MEASQEPITSGVEPMLSPFQQIDEDGHAGAMTYLARLVQESAEDRNNQGIDETVDDNLNVYAYGASDEPSDDETRANDIQNQVIAQVNTQVQDPPRVTLEPVETGEPPIVYWNGPAMLDAPAVDPMGQPIVDELTGQQAIVEAPPFNLPPECLGPWESIDPETGAVQVNPPQPIPQELADTILEAVAANAVPEKWVVEINDQTLAATFQNPFDVHWTRCGTDSWLRKAALKNAVHGFIFGLYEWDDDEKRHYLRSFPHRQVYIDPTVEDISEAAYVGIDLVRDADEAKKLFPHLADEIEQHKQTGYPRLRDGFTSLGSAYNRDFKRPVVTLRIFWLRNQMMPMSPDKATASGRVEARVVIDPTPELLAMQGQAQEAGAAAELMPDEMNQAAAMMAQEQLAGAVQAQQRLAYFVPGTDTEIDEKSEEWPQRRGIRQLTGLVEIMEVIDDRECEHWDIPMLHCQNIPLPDKPYGQGEPYRLKSMQRAENRMLGAMVDHTEFYRQPVSAISQSMYNLLPEQWKHAGIKAGMEFVIPDEQFMLMGGKLNVIHDPPALPQSLPQVYSILNEKIQDNGNHSDAARGQLPSAQASGKTVQLLQGASAAQASFRGMGLADMVERLGRLMLHSIVWRLSLDDLALIISKYPRHILQAFHERGRKADWNVKVTVPAAAAQLKAQREQQIRADFQMGLIDIQTAREMLRYDHRQIEQRMKAQMMQQAQMNPQQEGQPGDKGGKQEKEPGNAPVNQ